METLRKATIGRRTFLAASAAAGIAAALRTGARAQGGESMLKRKVPRTGEDLPAIGLGTWQTFDVGPSEEERAPRLEVLRAFLEAGGRVIDSSPMYGRAEEVTGDLLLRLDGKARPFLATKVWTNGKAAGEAQIRESFRRLRVPVVDLFQVHNLLDWETHLGTLRDLKAKGQIRYVGITHYSLGAFDQMEKLLRTEKLDFVQLPYSVATREAEKRLLPAAAETGTAVLVMRPFEEGELFRAVRGKPVPGWGKDIGATTWSQVFLKFILSHPAVNAVLPATSNPRHLAENVKAGFGPMPDDKLRKRMAEELRF
jgi:aryl-alcohol dehydrogenase-like predicted oxidoreductase